VHVAVQTEQPSTEAALRTLLLTDDEMWTFMTRKAQDLIEPLLHIHEHV
jgi:hypothetical protein